jgi:hypothetical protein
MKRISLLIFLASCSKLTYLDQDCYYECMVKGLIYEECECE